MPDNTLRENELREMNREKNRKIAYEKGKNRMTLCGKRQIRAEKGGLDFR